MKHSFALAILLVLCLMVKSENLKTEYEIISSCDRGLLESMTIPVASPKTDFIGLIDVINKADNPMPVINYINTFEQQDKDAFYFMAQAIHQTVQDYHELDDITLSQCGFDVSDGEYCEDSCTRTNPYPPVFAQVPKPKPNTYVDCAEDDPFCDNGIQYDYKRKCVKSIRTFRYRVPKEKRPQIKALELFNSFAGSSHICINRVFFEAFVPIECEEQIVGKFINVTFQRQNQIPMLNPKGTYQNNLKGLSTLAQLQSVYLLTRKKFEHQIAVISRGCNKYINTDPISDEEADQIALDIMNQMNGSR